MFMAERDALGLSLSIGGGAESGRAPRIQSLHLNLMPPSSQPFFLQRKPPAAAADWNDLAASTSGEEESMRRFLKGIDVNRAPAGDREIEDDAGASSPGSTVSSVSGKRGVPEESENERACSGGGQASDEEDGGEGSRKKLRLSKDQSAVLEESFKEHSTLNPKQKLALAKHLNLRPRQVEVWFQNRRARTKLKQTEVDCEFLKRCCENLTEENRRLQKEVQELRALKLSPQFYMHMTPPTTLTMCPSCERVAVPCSAPAAATTSLPAKGAGPVPMDAQNHRNSNDGSTTNRQQFFHQNQQHKQQLPFLQQQQQQQSRGPVVLPWAPMPLRTAAFLDAQRS